MANSCCSFLTFLMLCVVMSCVPTTYATSLNLIRTTCGGLLPLDSLYPIESYWSLRDLLDWRSTNATVDPIASFLTLGHSPDIAESVLGALERVTGLASSYVNIFQLDNLAGVTGCRVAWEPREVLFISTVISAASVAVIPYAGAGITCPLSVVASSSSGVIEFPIITVAGPSQNITSSIQQTLIVRDGLTWPVSFELQGGAMCSAYVVIAVNRQVSLSDWWSWIPAVVYSAVVIPIALFSAFSHRKMGASSFAFMIGVVYIGYVGVSVGLMITIAGWQVSIGRFFPFPSSVTLYVALWVVYALVLPLLLFRHPCRAMLANALGRSLVYGFFVAQMVSYWVLGFVAIGSVALAVVFITNGLLIFFYAQFVTLLATSKDVRAEMMAMPMAWMAPVTPFIPPVLMYADLFFAHHASGSSRRMDPRLREAVILFNLQTALPFVAFLECGMVALLVAATVRQPTFLVPLFMTILLVGWFTTWTIQQYFTARSEWEEMHSGGVITSPTPQWTLWPAIHSLIDRFNVDVYHARQQQLIMQQQQQLASGGGALQLFSSGVSGRSAVSSAGLTRGSSNGGARQAPKPTEKTTNPAAANANRNVKQPQHRPTASSQQLQEHVAAPMPSTSSTTYHHQRGPSQQFSAPATSRSNSVQHQRSASGGQQQKQPNMLGTQRTLYTPQDGEGYPQHHQLVYASLPEGDMEDNYDLHPPSDGNEYQPSAPYRQDRQYSPHRQAPQPQQQQDELVLEGGDQHRPTSYSHPPTPLNDPTAPAPQLQRHYTGGTVLMEYGVPGSSTPPQRHQQHQPSSRQYQQQQQQASAPPPSAWHRGMPASGTPYDADHHNNGAQWQEEENYNGNYH